MSDINVSFGAKDEGLKSALASAQASVMGFAKSAAGVAAGVAGVGVALGAAAVAALDFKGALEMSGRLNDLSGQTGETAGNLAVLERAFRNAGISADSLGPAINKMQRNIVEAGTGAKEQAASLSALGLSYDELKGKTPTEQMALLASRISEIPDPSQRAAAAMDIFGKSGGELLPVLTNFSGEIGTAKGQLGSLPGVLDRTAGSMDGLGDSLAAIETKRLEFSLGLLSGITKEMTTIAEKGSEIDAANFGVSLGESIGKAISMLREFFGNPRRWLDATEAELNLALAKAVNEMATGLVTAAVAFGKGTVASAKDVGIIALNGLQLAGASLNRLMLSGASAMLDKLSGIPMFGEKIKDASAALSSAARDAEARAQGYAAALADASGSVSDAFSSAIASSKDIKVTIFDTGKLLEEATRLAKENLEAGAKALSDGASDIANAKPGDAAPTTSTPAKPGRDYTTGINDFEGDGKREKDSNISFRDQRRIAREDDLAQRFAERGRFRAAERRRQRAEQMREAAQERANALAGNMAAKNADSTAKARQSGGKQDASKNYLKDIADNTKTIAENLPVAALIP